MHNKTIAELSRGLQQGDFSSEELTRHFLARIESMDGTLNSFIPSVLSVRWCRRNRPISALPRVKPAL